MKHVYLLLLLFLTITTAQAQIVNIPDANFKAKLLNHNPVIDTNGDGEIQVSEAEAVTGILNISYNSFEEKITNMTGIEAFVNITDLYFTFQMVSNIDLSNNLKLKKLDCSGNVLTSLNVSNNVLLTDLYCPVNKLTSLDLSSNTELINLKFGNNLLETIDLSKNLYLTELNCYSNRLSALDVSNNILLKSLYCVSSDLVSLDLSKNTLLDKLDCSNNKLTALDLSQNKALTILSCYSNKLTALDLSNNTSLSKLECKANYLTSLDVSNNVLLYHLDISGNNFSGIDLSQLTKLIILFFDGNRISQIDLSKNTKLQTLHCDDNLLKEIDLSNKTGLNYLKIRRNLVTTLDLSDSPNLRNIFASQNYFLKNVNLKSMDFLYYNSQIDFLKCPNLETICVNDADIAALYYRTLIDPHAVFVEDCSLSNVDYNLIQGVLTLDENNNGCDGVDPIIPNILIKSTDGTNKFATLTDTNGTYSIPVLDKTYETTPQGLFSQGNISINPTSYTTTFTGFSNTETADFCINFNQNSYDLNVKLIPIIPARPGFDTIYQLVYENLGVTVDSGSIILTFDDTMQSFVSASPAEDASTSNTITFNFTNLKPFEKRVINVTMNTFTPPTVNGDDILNFVATITPTELDVTPEDNTYILAQTVVNSFDPNDKQVLQGTEITVDETGNYLDYIIRFQNTGTASAINVAITDVLTPRLDWDSIKIISASHPYSTRITNGNFVEFIFNINLPAEQEDEPASHGFIAFKINPRSTVVIGDIISGNASIYFDYNAPIITNSVSTTVVENTLSINKNELEASLRIYPNPATTELNIKVSKDVKVNKVSFYSVTGKLLFSTLKTSSNYDLTNFKSGIYFVKVETNKGVVNKKIIKK